MRYSLASTAILLATTAIAAPAAVSSKAKATCTQDVVLELFEAYSAIASPFCTAFTKDTNFATVSWPAVLKPLATDVAKVSSACTCLVPAKTTSSVSAKTTAKSSSAAPAPLPSSSTSAPTVSASGSASRSSSTSPSTVVTTTVTPTVTITPSSIVPVGPESSSGSPSVVSSSVAPSTSSSTVTITAPSVVPVGPESSSGTPSLVSSSVASSTSSSATPVTSSSSSSAPLTISSTSSTPDASSSTSSVIGTSVAPIASSSTTPVVSSSSAPLTTSSSADSSTSSIPITTSSSSDATTSSIPSDASSSIATSTSSLDTSSIASSTSSIASTSSVISSTTMATTSPTTSTSSISTSKASSTSTKCISTTVTAYSGVSAAIASCTVITLSNINVPTNSSLDLSKAKANSHITFDGTTTFAYTNSSTLNPIMIGGVNITVDANPGAIIDGNGQAYWDGQGSNGGIPKPDHFVAVSKVTGTSFIRNLYIQNYPTHCFYISNCLGLTLQGITLDNSAGYAPNAISNGLPAAHNTDGFDLSTSNNTQLLDSTVINQDDCVAVSSGVNVTISNVSCSGSHGLSIGSVGGKSNNYVDHIYFLNSSCANCQNGARIKSNSGTTGTITNIFYENIYLTGVTGYGIDVQQDYLNGGPTGVPTNGVMIANITMTNITGTATSSAQDYYILCGSGSCSNFDFNDIYITGGGVASSCNYGSSGTVQTGDFTCPTD